MHREGSLLSAAGMDNKAAGFRLKAAGEEKTP
jgi:hypothetical protein